MIESGNDQIRGAVVGIKQPLMELQFAFGGLGLLNANSVQLLRYRLQGGWKMALHFGESASMFVLDLHQFVEQQCRERFAFCPAHILAD